jgi:hypothetical protein
MPVRRRKQSLSAPDERQESDYAIIVSQDEGLRTPTCEGFQPRLDPSSTDPGDGMDSIGEVVPFLREILNPLMNLHPHGISVTGPQSDIDARSLTKPC